MERTTPGALAITAALLIGLSAPPAQAGYIVDLTQQGSNVVATGSGTIDLTGLTFAGSNIDLSIINPVEGVLFVGPAGYGNFGFSAYLGVSGEPASFGSGDGTDASSGSGDSVGIEGFDAALVVPAGYASGGPLSDTATWDNATFSGLGVTPGTYVWTWGSGMNQNFTLVVGTVGVVPEPSTWAMMLFGLAGLGFTRFQLAPKRLST